MRPLFFLSKLPVSFTVNGLCLCRDFIVFGLSKALYTTQQVTVTHSYTYYIKNHQTSLPKDIWALNHKYINMNKSIPGHSHIYRNTVLHHNFEVCFAFYFTRLHLTNSFNHYIVTKVSKPFKGLRYKRVFCHSKTGWYMRRNKIRNSSPSLEKKICKKEKTIKKIVKIKFVIKQKYTINAS